MGRGRKERKGREITASERRRRIALQPEDGGDEDGVSHVVAAQPHRTKPFDKRLMRVAEGICCCFYCSVIFIFCVFQIIHPFFFPSLVRAHFMRAFVFSGFQLTFALIQKKYHSALGAWVRSGQVVRAI